MTIKQTSNNEHWEDEDDLPVRKNHGRSLDYEKKRRRAERILEESRIRELLGMNIDYYDEEPRHR